MVVKRTTDPYLRDSAGNPIGTRALSSEEQEANIFSIPASIQVDTNINLPSQEDAIATERKRSGQESVRQREKLASRAGISSKEAAEIIARQESPNKGV